jgi:hypothetical protein
MIKLKNLLPECEDCGRNWNHGQDHEASMAKNELRDMISNASKIDNLVGDNDQLPGWVSAYISLAADYMHSVAEYLAGESTEPEHQPGPGFSEMKKESIFNTPQMGGVTRSKGAAGYIDNTSKQDKEYADSVRKGMFAVEKPNGYVVKYLASEKEAQYWISKNDPDGMIDFNIRKV